MARVNVDSASDCEEDPHLGGYISGHNNDSRRGNGVRSHVEHNGDADNSLGAVREVVNEMPQQERALNTPVNGRVAHSKPSRNRFRNRRKCELCDGIGNRNHHISNCYVFLSRSDKEKMALAEARNLCLNCLQRGHTLANCRSKHRCMICFQFHHTVLHEAFVPKPRPGYIPANASELNKDCPVRLELIPLTVRHEDSCVVVNTYAWLGGAVNRTLCSERLLRKLNVNPPRQVKHVQNLVGSKKCNGHVVTLILQGVNMKQKFILEGVYSTPKMASMDGHILDNKTAKHYSEMFDIEIPVLDHSDVDLLLGQDILGPYPRSYGNTAFPGCPNVSLIPLGWVVHGQDRRMKPTDTHFVSFTLTTDCTQSECCRKG